MRPHPALFLLAAGLGTAVLYVAALHPWTGALGGLVHLLVGWALPSMAVAALSLGLAWLVPATWPVRIVLAVVLSTGLGLNTALPLVPQALAYVPTVSSHVERYVEKRIDQANRGVAVEKRAWGPVFTQPFGPRVRVAGDEGCGCFYFLDAANSLYSDRVIDALYRAGGHRSAIVDYPRLSDPASEQTDAHLDLTLWRRPGGYAAVVEIYDRGTVIARFEQTGIPFDALTERPGVGRGRLAEDFWPNARDLLLHDNVWTALLGRLTPGYFPQRELEAFLRGALVPP